MAQLAEFTSLVHNGRPALPHYVDNMLRRMEGKPLQVMISEPVQYSSCPQRKYYFACIVEPVRRMFLEHGTNLTKDETHEYLKRHVGKLLRDVTDPVTGEVTAVLRSYRRLSKQETELYHLQCRQWAAECGLDLAEPNE